MRFNISRSSADNPDCAEAFQTNDGDDWFIEIKDLQQLVDFVKNNGEIVFDGDSIEIYDTYRE